MPSTPESSFDHPYVLTRLDGGQWPKFKPRDAAAQRRSSSLTLANRRDPTWRT